MRAMVFNETIQVQVGKDIYIKGYKWFRAFQKGPCFYQPSTGFQ